MNAPAKIPATIVTGFLGAGKTTLIRRLLGQANGRRIALIVNEFGDMGFDGELLSDCGDAACGKDDIVELTNGCICCTVADDFLPTMEALIARDPAPDHIIIETSGLALPQPLVAAFGWPTVKHRVTVDGVVSVVDAAAVADGRFAHDHDALDAQRAEDESLDHESAIEELFEDQVKCADLIMLSKWDLVDEEALARVRHTVDHHRRNAAEIIKAPRMDTALTPLFGLLSAAEDDLVSRKSHHDDDHDHDHDDFESHVIDGVAAASLQDVERIVAEMAAVDGVLRVKGRVAVSGKAPAIVQAVGPRVDVYFDRPGSEAPGRLVVIGEKGFDRDKLMASAG